MKTKIFTLAILVSFISSLGAVAQNRSKVYSNTENTGKEVIKEFTLFADNSSDPRLKKVHVYDLSGKRQKTTCFAWDEKTGWIEMQSYAYKYTNDKLTTVSFTKKDEKNGKKSPLVCNIIYTYDESGTLLSMEKIMVEDIIDNLLVEK